MDQTDTRTSPALRKLSKRVFNSHFRIEVALAASDLEDTFIFEELWELILEVSRKSEVDPPSESKVREEVARLRQDLGVFDRLPRVKGSLIQREIRKAGPFWQLCRELAERAA